MPWNIGVLMSMKMATMHELRTVYGVGDLYDMIEIVMVDAHNRRAREEVERGDHNR